jgi:hypothetical protein
LAECAKAAERSATLSEFAKGLSQADRFRREQWKKVDPPTNVYIIREIDAEVDESRFLQYIERQAYPFAAKATELITYRKQGELSCQINTSLFARRPQS